MSIFIYAIALVAVVMIAATVWVGRPRGPALEDVEHLRTPAILEMDPQKVLLVQAVGDPNVVGKRAFGLLMKAYFRLKGVPKGGASFKPPRARWPVGEAQPMEEWLGMYAMPVPDSVKAVPDVGTLEGLSVELATWDYGLVAQVLHVGRWDQETDTVRELHDFIREVRA